MGYIEPERSPTEFAPPSHREETFCPYCGGIRRVKRLGVIMTPLKARIFDLIRTHPGMAGDEISRIVYEGRVPLATIKAHVSQINDLLVSTDYRLRGDKFTGYRLIKLASPDRRC